MTLEITPIQIKQDIQDGDELFELIISAIKSTVQDGDIIVVSQKVISKQEGRIVNLSAIIPSLLAVGIASEYEKDPKLVEAILSESKRIVRMESGVIIVETNHGFVCANAGVDESNVENGYVTLLPLDSNKSAARLQKQILEKTKKTVAVIISDTFGRPFRLGQTDCAIGISGMKALLDYRGKKDTFGKMLRVTEIAVADELCAAAELAFGKTSKCPAALISNYDFTKHDDTSESLLRPDDQDLFK